MRRVSFVLLPSFLVSLWGCSDATRSRRAPVETEAGMDAGGSGGRTSSGGARGDGGTAAGGERSGGATGSGGAPDAGDASLPPTDGGTPEGGDAPDGPLPYCPLTDFVPRTCGDAGVCGAEEGCFRGVCLRTCGAPLDTLDTILGDAVEPVATICNARAGLYNTRTRIDGDCVRADVFGYRIFGGAVADEVGWTFRSYEVDPFLPSPAQSVTGSGAFASPGGSPFFQSMPTLNPSGTRLGSYLYYNTGLPSPMVVHTDGSQVDVGPAFARSSYVYGHDWLDDDRWILAEGGAGARFVALDPASAAAPVPLLTGFGAFAGSVRVVHGHGVVLAGTGDDLYVVPLARVLAVADGTVAAPIDVTTDAEVQHLTASFLGTFRLIADTHLVTSQDNYGDPLQVRTLGWSGTTLTLGPPRTLLTNVQAFEAYVPLVNDLVYLPHFSRALVARWAP